jgi:NhaC family Na+:H+ antiporter
MVVLLIMIRLKVSPFPAIFSCAILGGVLAAILQPSLVADLAGGAGQEPALSVYLKGIWIALFDGYQSNIGIPVLDNLLSKGGMSSMLVTVWLIISAMAFGGALQHTGILEALLSVIKKAIRGASSAILTAMATCLGMNVITGDQYISIVLPGRMYQPEFKKLRLSSLALSRAVEDAGTISSPLIPWNTCGAFMAGTLGVATFSYLPYALFNLFNLVLAALFASLGWFIVYSQKEESLAT